MHAFFVRGQTITHQQHGRPSRLLRPWACLELKGRHGCSPRRVAGSVNEPTSAGSAVRRPCWPASAVAGGRRVGMGGCGQHFSPFGRIQSRLQQVLIGRNGTSSRRKAAHWSVDYCSPTASKRSLAAPPPCFENRSSPSLVMFKTGSGSCFYKGDPKFSDFLTVDLSQRTNVSSFPHEATF